MWAIHICSYSQYTMKQSNKKSTFDIFCDIFRHRYFNFLNPQFTIVFRKNDSVSISAIGKYISHILSTIWMRPNK